MTKRVSLNNLNRSSKSTSIFSWIVSFLVPVFLILTATRILLFPWFLSFEYSMPGFPEDSFGFSKADRLYWSRIAMDFLVNDAGIDYLGDLRFSDGSPVYNERELRHMVDVKVAIQIALRVWWLSLVGLVVSGAWAGLSNRLNGFWRSIRRGVWLTIFLVIGVVIFVAVGFGIFFVAFHNLFFEPGTWTFLWSDTLIRLFPERFWRDIFIYIAAISAGLGIVLWIVSNAHPGARLTSRNR